MERTKKAQVWIETAIYSLIGMTIIAILLTAAMPQIEKMKDRAIISQTTTALNELDNQITEIMQAPGNIRIVYFNLAKGNIEINSETDKIIFTLKDTKLELSEINQEITEGNIRLKTERYGKNFKITLTLDYSESLDLTYKQQNQNHFIQSGITDYKIKIENPGTTSLLDKIPIDIDIL